MGERKTEENYIKNGEKGLKNASFWVCFAPPAANLFAAKKKMNLKRGVGGNDRNARYISLSSIFRGVLAL